LFSLESWFDLSSSSHEPSASCLAYLFLIATSYTRFTGVAFFKDCICLLDDPTIAL
jgi:hypothetical protein